MVEKRIDINSRMESRLPCSLISFTNCSASSLSCRLPEGSSDHAPSMRNRVANWREQYLNDYIFTHANKNSILAHLDRLHVLVALNHDDWEGVASQKQIEYMRENGYFFAGHLIASDSGIMAAVSWIDFVETYVPGQYFGQKMIKLYEKEALRFLFPKIITEDALGYWTKPRVIEHMADNFCWIFRGYVDDDMKQKEALEQIAILQSSIICVGVNEDGYSYLSKHSPRLQDYDARQDHFNKVNLKAGGANKPVESIRGPNLWMMYQARAWPSYFLENVGEPRFVCGNQEHYMREFRGIGSEGEYGDYTVEFVPRGGIGSKEGKTLRVTVSEEGPADFYTQFVNGGGELWTAGEIKKIVSELKGLGAVATGHPHLHH